MKKGNNRKFLIGVLMMLISVLIMAGTYLATLVVNDVSNETIFIENKQSSNIISSASSSSYSSAQAVGNNLKEKSLTDYLTLSMLLFFMVGLFMLISG